VRRSSISSIPRAFHWPRSKIERRAVLSSNRCQTAVQRSLSGTYVFYVRFWAFRGVREEDVLAVAALHLESGESLDEDSADRLVQLARVEGTDWLGASGTVDAQTVTTQMEKAEEDLDVRYRSLLESKRNENADRARFQLNQLISIWRVACQATRDSRNA